MSTPTTIDDGGPAFPFAPNDEFTDDRKWGSSGMSLRDWFAGQTLAGFIASDRSFGVEWKNEKGERKILPHGSIPSGLGWRKVSSASGLITRQCYAYADAMLAARKDPTA